MPTTDAACLEFHHEAGEKVDTIARMLADGRSRAVVRRELQKCTVLCANCHRKRHFEPPGHPDGEHDKNK
jgi:hypothetical protein